MYTNLTDKVVARIRIVRSRSSNADGIQGQQVEVLLPCLPSPICQR